MKVTKDNQQRILMEDGQTMQIVIIATGSRGDVQPYIALAKGLREAGNGVRFVTHQNFEPLVTAHGLDFWLIAGDVQEIVQDQVMRERIESGNFLLLMSQMAKEAQRGAVRLAEGGLDACRGMDLILGGMGGVFIGLSLAEKLKLPFLQAYLVPFTPTHHFPSALASNLPNKLGRFINPLTHHLARQMIWQGFRSADRMARRQVLDLPSAPFFGPYNSDHTRDLPVIYGISPSVVPQPDDWDESIHVVGYWFLESSDDWVPPGGLIDFLEDGPPPVYIGFGSMSNRQPEETTKLILEALQVVNQRAILSSGWGGLKSETLPESVYMIESVPHAWLFPRVAAVVHHGGAGTTAAGLRAGVPSIIVPFFGDQPYWGRLIADLGVGPPPISRKRLTADRLADAINMAVTNNEIGVAAAQLGAKVRAEDGVSRAVEIIEQIEIFA